MSLTNKPKVSFFLPSFEGGGAEQNLVNILKNIDREQYEITLVLAEKKGVFLDQVPKHIFSYMRFYFIAINGKKKYKHKANQGNDI